MQRCWTLRSDERPYASISCTSLEGGGWPECTTSFMRHVSKYARVGPSRSGRSVILARQSIMTGRGISSASSVLAIRYPYSPSTHAIIWMTIEGMTDVSCSDSSTSLKTILARCSTESIRSCMSSSSSSPLPSAIRVMRLCATSFCTRSPASSNTRVIVRTYQPLSGAKRSEEVVIRETRSDLRNSSVVPSSTLISLATMNSTLTGLIIRYRRSNVLRRRVSSGSSRHSITAN
mmetsp:Transcript_32098/g.74107  ORF Transcript_32098/g.74107 Transcript_32098/m.74107 type:complete len:233 (+) Transcript_32098:582-1280(+)